ncbi:MAG: MFS transporter [Chloroflexi bacterium]|nr:MFS transporter [Chloroflexota bacterium]
MSLVDRRAYLIFAALSGGFLMTSITGTIVSVALPTMLKDLDTNLAWVGWTLTGYQLASSILMPISGKLADDWGARRVFLGAVVLFVFSSILAGAAPDVYVLVLARMLQALSHAGLMTSATSIVSDCFGDRRAAAIGMFTSVMPIGGVIGPNIGGFIIDHFSWRWMFYGNIPFGAIIFLLGLVLIPRGGRSAGGKQVDTFGIGLFAGGMVAVLAAMTTWSNDTTSLGNPTTWVVAVVGLIILVLFLRHEGRTPSPIIELELLRTRPFLATNLYNFLYGLVLFSAMGYIPYLATKVYDMTAAESGMILTPRSLAMIAASTVSSVFLIRWGYRFPMILGFLFSATSLLLVSQYYHDASLMGLQIPNVVLLSAIVMLLGLGHGTAAPPSSNASLDLVPGKVAAVVGIRGMFRSTGGTFGLATTVLVVSQFQDEAMGLKVVFLGLGLAALAAIPLVFLIPDAARQRFVAARDKQRRDAVSTTD